MNAISTGFALSSLLLFALQPLTAVFEVIGLIFERFDRLFGLNVDEWEYNGNLIATGFFIL